MSPWPGWGWPSFVLMAVTGGMYLFRRDLAWDHWSRAALEIGWLCCSLTLATGSLWAHAAWNTWWTWDPRLTTAFVLWAMYSAALVLRSGVEDPHRRARIGAIVAIVGVLDVPLVIMATRWFRGIHPKSPHMEPTMRVVLLISVVCFTVFFTMLLLLRRSQLRVADMLEDLQEYWSAELRISTASRGSSRLSDRVRDAITSNEIESGNKLPHSK